MTPTITINASATHPMRYRGRVMAAYPAVARIITQFPGRFSSVGKNPTSSTGNKRMYQSQSTGGIIANRPPGPKPIRPRRELRLASCSALTAYPGNGPRCEAYLLSTSETTLVGE